MKRSRIALNLWGCLAEARWSTVQAWNRRDTVQAEVMHTGLGLLCPISSVPASVTGDGDGGSHPFRTGKSRHFSGISHFPPSERILVPCHTRCWCSSMLSGFPYSLVLFITRALSITASPLPLLTKQDYATFPRFENPDKHSLGTNTELTQCELQYDIRYTLQFSRVLFHNAASHCLSI